MAINERLYLETYSSLWDFGCFDDEIRDLLLYPAEFIVRRQKAINLIETMMTLHGKQELLKHLAELARIEHGIREIEPGLRDHVVHALLTFILGVYVKEKFSLPITNFQWKLAGLFHDIAYPVQISNDILRSYTARVNEIKNQIGNLSPDIRFRIVPGNFAALHNNKNSFDLIQENLNNWHLDINARVEYNQMIENGFICHGILSALTLLYIVDLMYQINNPERLYIDTYSNNSNINWNQINFENEVVPACSAIFIHNLNINRFSNSKINPTLAPLPFLLRLCDVLQEWERPSLNNITGISNLDFDIKFENDVIVFQVRDSSIAEKILNDLNRTICTDRIMITELF